MAQDADHPPTQLAFVGVKTNNPLLDTVTVPASGCCTTPTTDSTAPGLGDVMPVRRLFDVGGVNVELEEGIV